MKKEVGINQLKRRDFLKAGLVFGAGASGLAAGYAAVPDAFARAVYAAKKEGAANDNILVMIQLAGGNDGLRTLVPLADPTLHDLRPKLAGPMVSQALPINSQYGLNHNLGGIKGLWDKGKVAIVQGVGYPNPTFSHFESIRIWETGDPTRRQVDGWLGRTLASSYDSNGHPLTGCACGATDTPGALRDLQATLTVIQNQKTFGFTGGGEVEAAVGALYKGTPGIYGALFDTAIATATETMATLRTSASTYQPMADYTDKVKLVYSSKNQLAAALQLAAELIVTGTGVKLLHVTLGGFDTHYTELNRHDDLMGYLDSAVSAFYKDLAAHNMADKVEAVRRSGERNVEARWRYFSLTQVNSKDEGWTVWDAPAAEHVHGRLAFAAAEAARRQDRFEQLHETLLLARHRDRADIEDRAVVERVAISAGVGLDAARFRRDLADPSILESLARDHTEAVTVHGVFGTPTFVFAGGPAAYVRLAESVTGNGVVQVFDNLVTVAAGEPRILEIKRPYKR
jgi:uncharacterized protein (DUF1501 family)